MTLERIHTSMVSNLGDSFNPNQKDLAEATLTASNADIYTVPAATRTIIWSIHATNTDTVERTITSTLSDSTAGPAEYKIAHVIPIPTGSSVELLKRPKVLETGDKIRGLASATAVMDVTVVGIELTADSEHFNAGVNLTTTSLTTLFTGTSSGQMIESILLTNDDGVDNVSATVTWTTNSGGLNIDWVKDIVVPAGGSLEILEAPKSIATGDTIKVQASHANRLDVILAGRDK